MGRIRMGYWDCPYCSQVDVPGDTYSCPNCGRPRDNTVIFHPNPHGKSNAPVKYVTDPAEAERLRKSPDWLCSFCDSLVSDSRKTCPGCGHTREESDRNYHQLHQERTKMLPFTSNDDHEKKQEKSPPRRVETPRYDPTPAPSYRSSSSFDIPWGQIGTALLIVALVACVIVAAWQIFAPKERYITVTDMYWSRSIEVEEYRTVRESDWYVPAGGRLQYSYEEIHHYEQVFDHNETVTHTRSVIVGSHEEVVGYTDLGNGFFEENTVTVYEYGTETTSEDVPVYRSEPVYQTRYYYDIERWVYDHTVESSAHDHNPYWPEVQLKNNERTSTHHESYKITAVYDEDKSSEYDMKYKDWVTTSVGDELHVKVHFGGRIELLFDEGTDANSE